MPGGVQPKQSINGCDNDAEENQLSKFARHIRILFEDYVFPDPNSQFPKHNL